MSPVVVTILLATSQPGIGQLYRSGVDSFAECRSFTEPRGLYGKNNLGASVLMSRCDQLHKFMVCASHSRLDCIPKDVAGGDEHTWTVRYHKLSAPIGGTAYAIDGIIPDGTP